MLRFTFIIIYYLILYFIVKHQKKYILLIFMDLIQRNQESLTLYTIYFNQKAYNKIYRDFGGLSIVIGQLNSLSYEMTVKYIKKK